MGETTYPCVMCGGIYFDIQMKWKSDEQGHNFPYCPDCWGIMNMKDNLRRIEDLHAFAKELLAKWEKDCPHSAEYLRGYVSTLEIVLALMKGD